MRRGGGGVGRQCLNGPRGWMEKTATAEDRTLASRSSTEGGGAGVVVDRGGRAWWLTEEGPAAWVDGGGGGGGTRGERGRGGKVASLPLAW